MNRISGPDGLPHSCAEMVRPSGVFTLIGLCFSCCPMPGCAIATRNAATANLARRLPSKDIVMANPLSLEHALGHLELPARGSQSLRENLPDPRVFIRIVDFRATGIRHQGRGERVQVVVPSAELHEARRRLAAVEMLVEPLERRHHEGSFLPIELLHLLLLAFCTLAMWCGYSSRPRARTCGALTSRWKTYTVRVGTKKVPRSAIMGSSGSSSR